MDPTMDPVPFGYITNRDRPPHAPPVPGHRPILDNHQLSNYEGNLSDAIITTSAPNSLNHDREPPILDEAHEQVILHDMTTHLPGQMLTAGPTIAQSRSHMVSSALTHGPLMSQMYTDPLGHISHSIDPAIIQQFPAAQFTHSSHDLPPQGYHNFGSPQFFPGAIDQAAIYSPFGGHPSPGFLAGQHEHGFTGSSHPYRPPYHNPNGHEFEWGSDMRFQEHGFVGHQGNGGEFVVNGPKADLVDTLQREESAPNTRPPSPGNRSRKQRRQMLTATNSNFGGSYRDGDDCAECKSGNISDQPKSLDMTTVQGDQGCKPQSKRRRRAPGGPKQNNAKQAQGTQKKSGKKNLTGEQKKQHHNDSEKARREKLSKSFKRIAWAAPAYGFGDSQNGRLLATEQWIKDLHSIKLKLSQQLADATGQ